MTRPKCPGRASILFLTLCKENFKFEGSYKSGQSQKGIFHFHTIPPYLKWNSARKGALKCKDQNFKNIYLLLACTWQPIDFVYKKTIPIFANFTFRRKKWKEKQKINKGPNSSSITNNKEPMNGRCGTHKGVWKSISVSYSTCWLRMDEVLDLFGNNR
jgi:hypothetical protein